MSPFNETMLSCTECLINSYHGRMFENANEQFKKSDLVTPLGESASFRICQKAMMNKLCIKNDEMFIIVITGIIYIIIIYHSSYNNRNTIILQ